MTIIIYVHVYTQATTWRQQRYQVELLLGGIAESDNTTTWSVCMSVHTRVSC